MYFFSETRPLLWHFLKKDFLAPLKCQTLENNFKIQKFMKNGIGIGIVLDIAHCQRTNLQI